LDKEDAIMKSRSACTPRLFFQRLVFATVVMALVFPDVCSAISEKNFSEDYATHVVPFYEGGVFGEFEGRAGVRIRYAAFEQDHETGALVILHGKSESYIKYAEVVYDLQELGFSCYLMDHRGFGFSERIVTDDPQKVYVEQFDDYVDDVKTFIDTVVRAKEHQRIFVLAHSLGGCIATRYCERYPEDIDAAVLSAPMVQINTGTYPPAVAYAIAASAAGLGFGTDYAIGQGPREEPWFVENTTTHSFARWSKWEEDLIPSHPEIRSGGATYNWVKVCLEAGWRARREASRIATPLLIFQAEEDSFVRPEGQEELCDAAQDCRLIIFHGSRHEILMERDTIRDVALDFIRTFFQKYLE